MNRLQDKPTYYDGSGLKKVVPGDKKGYKDYVIQPEGNMKHVQTPYFPFLEK
ncbi:hypothetical protein N0O92_14155 [Alkalihalobacillus sp. MEB130]|uniref:hypothetical protein n=1 Tax=Alkalihalobacillus sp. MEB130 TaxID=2976704 RepID=UPI0028E05F18|nr:hypothetical protein [Alkalihalobacillus sp. MEB130]MDT8861379.1 hypothetical protein [Alkalihalobacillus sp. MEB130]